MQLLETEKGLTAIKFQRKIPMRPRSAFINRRSCRELQYHGENYKWGTEIPDYGLRHRWFKLALDPDNGRGISELAAKYQDPLAAPPDYERSPEKLTTDYLTAMKNQAERVLRNKLHQGALMSTPIEYVPCAENNTWLVR